MLHEVRKLLFSEDVLREALLEECASQALQVPCSALQGIVVDGYHPSSDQPGKGRVVLEFVTADPDNPYKVVLNEHFVIGALIIACRAYGVPLPRGAEKHLQMTDKGLAMTVSMRMETARQEIRSNQSDLTN